MTDVREYNFDGLVGPTHNYAGLSLGNIASAGNAGQVSHPRAAALQGLEKMRTLLRAGIAQGFLPPLRRPATAALRAFGFVGTDAEVLAAASREDPVLFNNACSASAMWAANAATVIAAPDSADGRVHLVAANLASMLHRSLEAADTFRNLARIFRDSRHFAVHPALPYARHLADEGAANHMRLSPRHGEPGLNVFVHGEARGGAYPERQARRAGEAVSRIAGIAPGRVLHARQAFDAVQAGAFHNDVVAVANENVLLAHPQAFDADDDVESRILSAFPQVRLVMTEGVTLKQAVRTYLFNSQLVTLPDGRMALVLPTEVEGEPAARAEVDRILADGDNPIDRAIFVDVRESMCNGGGPACLRLRVPMSRRAAAGVAPAFILDEGRLDRLARLVETHWPERIAPGDLVDPALWSAAFAAHDALEAFIEAENAD